MKNYCQLVNSGKLTPSSKRHPCPVCEDIKGKCRSKDNDAYILCMNIHESKGISLNRYISLGPSKDGLWTQYKLSNGNDWDNSRSENYRRARELREQRERDRLATGLSDSEKDRAFRELARSMGLKDSHRQNLKDRELTDKEISKRCYFSIDLTQPIPNSIPDKLPGVRWVGGKKYFSNFPDYKDAFVCPAFNKKGEIIGGQVRLFGESNNKYRHLINGKDQRGELPVTAIFNNPDSTDLYAIEGILKPHISAIKHNINVIGAAGGLFDNSPERIREYVRGIKRIIIPLDAGDIINHDVIRRWIRQIEFFKSLGLEVVILWWGQTTKEQDDIDELNSLENARIISFEEFLKLGNIPPLTPLKDIPKIERLKDYKLPKIDWVVPQKITPQTYEEILNTEGIQGVLNNDPTGYGKTHAVANMKPREGGKLYYVCQDPKNPTVKGIKENFTILKSRNKNGFYEDEDGRLREDKTRQFWGTTDLKIGANCHKADLFHSLHEKGYDPYQKVKVKETQVMGETEKTTTSNINPICASCLDYNTCKNVSGWFLHDANEALKHDRIIIHASVIPMLELSDKDNLTFDEPSQTLNPFKELKSSRESMARELDMMRPDLSEETYKALDSLLEKVRELQNPTRTKKGLGFSSEPAKFPRWGYDASEVVEQLKDEINYQSIIDELESHPLNILEVLRESDGIDSDQVQDKSSKLKDSLSYLRKRANRLLEQQGTNETRDRLSELPSNTLLDFVKAIAGDVTITFTIKKNSILITKKTTPIGEYLNGAKVIGLDATLDVSEFSKLLGIDESKIVSIASETALPNGKPQHLKNLKVSHFKTKGITGKNLTQKGLGRLLLMQKHFFKKFGKFPIIAHKFMKGEFSIGDNQYSDPLKIDGYWGNHSRGSNDFERYRMLMLIGPCFLNVGALRAQYRVMNGGSLEGFESWYESKCQQEILQALGRQRCHRYPDQEFHLIFITPDNVSLDWVREFGASLEVMDAVQVDEAAGTKGQQALLKIINAVKCGVKGSLRAIGKAINCSHEAVRKTLTRAGLTVESLRQKCQPFLTNSHKEKVDSLSIYSDLMNLDRGEFLNRLLSLNGDRTDINIDRLIQNTFAKLPKALQDKTLSIFEDLLRPSREDPPPEWEQGTLSLD